MVRTVTAADEEEFRDRLRTAGAEDGVFVFNVAEYLDERRKSGFIPQILEALHLPHLGSSAQAVRTALDKGRTKEILSRRGIPTPRFFVVAPGDSQVQEKAQDIGYPLMVKPLREGGHAGIDDDSVAHDARELEHAIQRVLLHHQQPSLVEEFIGGEEMREFSVGVIGSAARIHLPLEIDWERMALPTRILTFEAARRDRERVKPVRDPTVVGMLDDLADRTFDAVGAADYARVDIRGNRKGYSVLEINLMPGLGRRNFLPLAAREQLGLEQGDLAWMLLNESVRRQGLPAVDAPPGR